jgi:glycosyltransferase involved in cell wall biosynthesis
MNWPAQCAVIIPCLNESAAIGALVAAIRPQLSHVIVSDDGSTDDTGKLAAAAGAEVLRHRQPLGKGAALQAGWQWAHEKGFAWALTMDGDGQHSPADISKFLACAEQTAAELVVGNRMNDPEKMPWLRRIVNRWMSRRISARAGCDLPDSQCGFRLMNLKAWAGLPISAAHFEIESEVLLAFARARRRIEFVPIEVIYKCEQSKIDPWRDTIRWFRWWRKAK